MASPGSLLQSNVMGVTHTLEIESENTLNTAPDTLFGKVVNTIIIQLVHKHQHLGKTFQDICDFELPIKIDN